MLSNSMLHAVRKTLLHCLAFPPAKYESCSPLCLSVLGTVCYVWPFWLVLEFWSRSLENILMLMANYFSFGSRKAVEISWDLRWWLNTYLHIFDCIFNVLPTRPNQFIKNTLPWLGADTIFFIHHPSQPPTKRGWWCRDFAEKMETLRLKLS